MVRVSVHTSTPRTAAYLLSLLLLLLSLPALLALRPAGAQQSDPPRLMVLVVVDQLRGDLLQHYQPLFEGGLKRLGDEGLQFVNTTHDHAFTETSPGHATISTGTHPSRHGMVRNVWWEQSGGQWVQVMNVVDELVPLLGGPALAGGSPRRLMRSGLADWIRAASPESRVVTLSAKDRAAVLLAGKSRSIAYWIEPTVGRFMTSQFYRDEDPEWVSRFNREWMPVALADSAWEAGTSPEFHSLARRDSADYEGDRVHTYFTHFFLTPGERASLDDRFRALDAGEPVDTTVVIAGEAGPGASMSQWWDGFTPGPDAAVLALAREAVREERLGRDRDPDLLALSLSQTDRLGHKYGPMSREMLENLAHLDRELGSFMEFLDEEVGEGNWMMAFTADHGVQDMPEYLVETGRAGGRLSRDALATLQQEINAAVQTRAAEGPAVVAQAMAESARSLDWIADAWPRDLLLSGDLTGEVSGALTGAASEGPAGTAAAPDSFAVLMRNSMYPDRPADVLSRFGVEMILEPGTLDWLWPDGTTHGSPYYYDRHVPLVFMGPGIEPGVREDRAATVDIAPTVAAFLGVEVPGDLDGRDLLEATRER